MAADENNLYNGFKIFQYLGLLYIYKLLLKVSFFYPNTKFFFISKYVFVKTPTNFRKIFLKKIMKSIIILYRPQLKINI